LRVRQNNAPLDGGFLYAVFDVDSAFPVMGFFNGWDQSLDRALRQFLDSIRLPGGGGQPAPLFAPQEIAGLGKSSSL
jgi:hypothetical protein